MLYGPSGLAWSELAAVLDWLPLASLLLAADGSALAVSSQWSVLSGIAAEDSHADGWVSAVSLPYRGVLRARLRDAAAAGRTGHADVWLVGQAGGRWSRWWWRPGWSGRLVVCVADLGDLRAGDDRWQDDRCPLGRLVRRGEFVNLAERALRRGGHHGVHVAVAAIRLAGVADPGSGAGPAGDLVRAAAERVSAVIGPAGVAALVAPGEFVVLLDGLRTPGDARVIADRVRDAVSRLFAADDVPVQVTAVAGVAVADRSCRGAEDLIEKAGNAVRSGSHAAVAARTAPADPADPTVPTVLAAPTDPADPTVLAAPAGYAWPAGAGMLTDRLFDAGLALQSASALADGGVAARLQQVLEQLDAIIQDIRTAAFEAQAPQHYPGDED